jgi:hypothetical protein
MIVNRAAFAAILALAAAGCSGSHGNAGQSQAQHAAQSPAASGPTAPAEQATTPPAAAGGSTTVSSLPIYPGGKKLPNQMQHPMKLCGSTMSMTVYSIKNVDAASVAKWYDDRIANGVRISISPDANSSNYEIFEPDGSGAAVVTQMHFAGSLGKAAKTIGADDTTFGTETFDPPLSHDLVTLLVQGASGDPASKQAVKAQLKAKCGDTGLKDDG